MIVVYVSGKYTDESEWKMELNVRKAEKAAQKVWKSGMVAICPHLNTYRWSGLLSLDAFLEGDFELIKRSDVVLMLDNWEDSEGAKAERWCARRHKIPIVYSFRDLLEWKNRNLK